MAHQSVAPSCQAGRSQIPDPSARTRGAPASTMSSSAPPWIRAETSLAEASGHSPPGSWRARLSTGCRPRRPKAVVSLIDTSYFLISNVAFLMIDDRSNVNDDPTLHVWFCSVLVLHVLRTRHRAGRTMCGRLKRTVSPGSLPLLLRSGGTVAITSMHIPSSWQAGTPTSTHPGSFRQKELTICRCFMHKRKPENHHDALLDSKQEAFDTEVESQIRTKNFPVPERAFRRYAFALTKSNRDRCALGSRHHSKEKQPKEQGELNEEEGKSPK